MDYVEMNFYVLIRIIPTDQIDNKTTLVKSLHMA